MRSDKTNALRLRKLGNSYNKIRRQLHIPTSTLSGWLKDKKWSQDIKNELANSAQVMHTRRLKRLNRVRGGNLERIYKDARREARQDFSILQKSGLFIAGMAIYWGEGDKTTRHAVRISNTDADMVTVFIKFLVRICGVEKEKIRVSILLYPDLNDDVCRQHWLHATGLGADNFTKSTIIHGKHATKRLRYGVCNVNVSSTYLKEKILVWLKLFPVIF